MSMSDSNIDANHQSMNLITERFKTAQNRVYCNIDRLFIPVFLLQWVLAITLALLFASRTWTADQHSVNEHLITAFALGGLLTFSVCVLGLFYTGKIYTRMTIAIAQMLFGSLLIDITGGRIETHFHVFGSLAFLMLYRDWRVIVVATLVVVIDHTLRGVYIPLSVFGVSGAPFWRILEHAGWVVFEDIVLLYGCYLFRKEMWTIAEREVENQLLLQGLEKRVQERTTQLTSEIEQRKISEEEARSAREKAEHANRFKSEFLANMSHEIRTPMTAIIGFSDLLDDQFASGKDLDRAQCVEFLETIRKNGSHLLNIINDVLDLSKLEAGKFQIESIECNSQAIIEDVISMVRPRALSKKLQLNVNISDLVPAQFNGDPTRVKQIMINLIGNAIKFTERGCVTLTVSATPTIGKSQDGEESVELRFDVADTGIGIPQDKMDRLFGAFEQADGSMRRRFGGTGLGLRISRRLAELMNGSVSVKSQMGLGSIFTFTIPVDCAAGSRTVKNQDIVQADASLQKSNESHRSQDYLSGMRVLVVDDCVDNQRLVERLLQKSGASVELRDNGKRAIEALTQTGTIDGQLVLPPVYDIILLDMQMPEMDGYTAARRLKAKGFPNPIIAFTAHALEGEKKKCLDAGCDGYVTKPIDPKNLRVTIREMVDRNQKIAKAA